MKLDELIKSKTFLNGLKIFLGVLVVAVSFAAGIFVGVDKTRFSYSWSDNYYRNFAGLPPGPVFVDRGYMNAHGSFGNILTSGNNVITIRSSGSEEKTILVTNNTVIKKGGDDLNFSELAPGENIVTIGSPNDQGQIEATLIRVVPHRREASREINFF